MTQPLNDDGPESISPSEYPTSIKATFPGGVSQQIGNTTWIFSTIEDVLDALKRFVITSLDLRFALIGCSGWPSRWNLPFAPEGGERLAPLRHLGLDGYAFEQSDFDGTAPLTIWTNPVAYFDWYTGTKSSGSTRKAWLRYQALPEHQKGKTNLDLWLDAMDWSQLETLKLRNQHGVPESFRQKVTPHMTGLKGLTLFTCLGSANTTLEWIASLPALTQLKWINGFLGDTRTIDTLLAKHGPTIERLELRHEESEHAPRRPFSARNLRLLRSQAPRLQFLSIDLSQSGSWPYEALESLSSIPNLTELEIYFDYGSDLYHSVDGRDRVMEIYQEQLGDMDSLAALRQEPALTRSTALMLNEKLRSSKKGTAFGSISFYAGDWSRPWDGPLYLPPLLEGLRERFIFNADGLVSEDEEEREIEEELEELANGMFW